MKNILMLLFFVITSTIYSQQEMHLQVFFNEPMDTVDGLNTVENYYITEEAGGIPDNVSINNVSFHYSVNGHIINNDNLIDTILITTGPHLYQQFYRIEVNNVYDLAHNIINPDSNWYVYYVDNPLPVELSVFNITSTKKGIANLYWKTETEVNNYGFEIERAVEQKFEYFHNWETIGFVEGSGNSNSPKEYRYADTIRATKPLHVFYRLKQIDTDGQYEYSLVRDVTINNVLDSYTLFTYPNPFNSQVTLEIYFENKVNSVKGKVFNILGQEVFSWDDYDVAGVYKKQITFDVSMATGVYIFQVSTDKNYPIRTKAIMTK